LHLLPSGGHGYGLRKGIRAAETWPLLAEKWLAVPYLTPSRNLTFQFNCDPITLFND